MSSHNIRPYCLSLIFLLTLLFGVQTAQACSCAGSSTVLDEYNYADVVIVARAVSVEKVEGEETAHGGKVSDGEFYVDGVKSTLMRVEQVFKGPLKVGEVMTFEQGGGADCIWTFSEDAVGKSFLFYLKQHKEFTTWFASTCGRSNSVENAGDDLLYLTKLDKVRNKTRISGTLRIFQEASESFAGRKIRIVGAKITRELKADSNGVYEIYDLPPGRYFIEPEVPNGWKVSGFWLSDSPSLDRNAKDGSLQKIPIILGANKHASLDIVFEIDNAVRGRISDPMGQPMNGVCLNLVPADGTEGPYLADCTENDGAFEISKIPSGSYVIVVNNDGKMTSNEPFPTFYYPKALKLQDATVFTIGKGDKIEDLAIYPPIELATITVEGLLLYADGKPVAKESVDFRSAKTRSAGGAEDEAEDPNEAGTETDLKGRFKLKLVQGAHGFLFGSMYTYVGEFENCPRLDRLVKKTGKDVTEIETAPVEIRATTNLYGVELKFPFPSCKKARPHE